MLRPEAVLVDFALHTVEIGPYNTEEICLELVGPAEAAELAWSCRDGQAEGLPRLRALVSARIA